MGLSTHKPDVQYTGQYLLAVSANSVNTAVQEYQKYSKNVRFTSDVSLLDCYVRIRFRLHMCTRLQKKCKLVTF